MGHARLKSLRLKGLRSFAKESYIEFPESGMTLFKGRNLDSGGSSGSGKSSLLLAITYLLGFCKYPSTALQSWLTEDPLEVEGVFGVDEGELVISRGQKLALTLNGKKVAGSAKSLEEKLTQYIGLGPELLAALTYRGQKQPGLFLSKTDSEKKEFLTTLLDLGKFEAAVEASQVKVKALQQDLHTEEYVAGDTEKRINGYRQNANLNPIPEANLREQLLQAQGAKERIGNQVQALRQKLRQAEFKVDAGAVEFRAKAAEEIRQLRSNLAQMQEMEPREFGDLDTSRLKELREDLAQAQMYLESELAEDQKRYRAQRQHADSVHAQLVLIEKKLATKPGLTKRLAEIDNDLLSLGQDLCDRCKRPWDQAAQEKAWLDGERKQMLEALAGLESLKPEIEKLQKEYSSLGEFKPSPDIQEIRDVVSQVQKGIAEEQARLDSEVRVLAAQQAQAVASAKAALADAEANLAGRIQAWRSTVYENLQADQEQLETLEREERMADAHIRGIEASLSRVQIDNARVQQLQKTISDMENDLQATKARVEELRRQVNAELDFQKLTGREGFLGAIFDEVLWEISEETNRLLAQFPNTAHVTLHFRSESTSQKGTVKKSITPVVSIGGFEAPLSSGLSGGMETAVELAVDLAVAEVVSRRTGAVPGWLILDESFTGLGPVEAEACMEILRAFAEKKLVLVVDHASEFKSLFTQSVNVEYQGGFSRVTESA